MAIVGYTNAGKSTLLNTLTDAGVLAEDKLFATLDPTSRALKLPDGREVLLVDTVGFVRRLPHHLVKAFRSTLEEAVEADLILNICDASSPEAEEHLAVTRELLAELGCADRPILPVLNKCDAAAALPDVGRALRISAKTGEGLPALLEAVAAALPPDRRRAGRAVPPGGRGGAGGIRARWAFHDGDAGGAAAERRAGLYPGIRQGRTDMDIKKYCFTKRDSFSIGKFDTADTAGISDKEDARKQLRRNVERMAVLQDKFYAQDREALLLVFQAMDSAGKGGAVKHVMSGLNPQGVQVYSFKQPSAEELDHDYLWRIHRCLPERGNIGIFNRSYYEEVLVGKVHNLPFQQKLPSRCLTEDIWEKRYRQLRDYERYLSENGVTVVKFFLDISKDEQKKRFLARIDNEAKNWKFSAADIAERAHWDEYMAAYEDCINATASKAAPWYVIPADKKWFARLLISEIVVRTLEGLDPQYPAVSEAQKQALQSCRKQLEEA